MATEARKKAETVREKKIAVSLMNAFGISEDLADTFMREKIAVSLMDAFGISRDLADTFVRDEEIALEAHVDTDMLRGEGVLRTSMGADHTAVEEFFLDVQIQVGFEVPDSMVDQQISLLRVGRLRVFDLIKAVEDAVARGKTLQTPKEKEAKQTEEIPGIRHWEA